MTEKKQTEQTAFQIHRQDNVATALAPLSPGPVRLTGEADQPGLTALEEIPDGHKIAVTDIRAETPIIKYGIPIGTATADISRGAWVHLHCMRSNYDERSSHLDLRTGVPTDSEYL